MLRRMRGQEEGGKRGGGEERCALASPSRRTLVASGTVSPLGSGKKVSEARARFVWPLREQLHVGAARVAAFRERGPVRGLQLPSSCNAYVWHRAADLLAEVYENRAGNDAKATPAHKK